MNLGGLIAGVILTGMVWLAFKIRDQEPEIKATQRSLKAARKKPLSQESLNNILRLECNKGDQTQAE